jgi:hypothetical protein
MLTDEIEFQTHASPVIVSIEPHDLTNYLFRQKTQELLFKTKEHLQNIREYKEKDHQFKRYKSVFKETDVLTDVLTTKTDVLKAQLKDFFKSMLDYIEANKLKDDEFFKMLCDDIYIAIKSFDMENGLMFAAARHTSQGRQQSYTPRFEEAKEDAVTHNTLKRGYTLAGSSAVIQSNTAKKCDPDLNYQLSQNDISPYSSIGQVKLMRDVSYTQPTEEDLNTP